MLMFFGLTLFWSFVALGFFLYFWKKGQFKEVEDIKYQLFTEEEDL